MKSKYMKFIMTEKKTKSQVFSIFAKRGELLLGQVKWVSGGKEYCFFPEPQKTFNRHYLDDITDFIDEQTKASKLMSIKKVHKG